MKIRVKRYNTEYEPNEIVMEYVIADSEQTLLSALTYIKTRIDNTLTFSSGCRSEVCGSCAVRVNGKEVLACKYKVKDDDLIEPLKLSVIRDLVVDYDKALSTIHTARAYLDRYQHSIVTDKEVHTYELQSNCILCSSCYSACPVFMVNPSFLGPFTLTKVYKYTNDSKEANKQEKISNIQTNGIWDCTMCGECAFVCPQKIQPNMDIMMLRNQSYSYGFSDPNFAKVSNFGFDPLGGFNPNGF